MLVKGDIVLIPFPFTDFTGSKLRPALILNYGILDVTVNFISTKMHWKEITDLVLEPNEFNGLKKTSLVRIGKITTLEKALILGKIGQLNELEIKELNKKLSTFFKLDNSDF